MWILLEIMQKNPIFLGKDKTRRMRREATIMTEDKKEKVK